MKNLVYFRADGNERTGLGHLVRCSAIAHMLKDDFDITFFCHSIPGQLENEFKSKSFKVIRITEENEFFDAVAPDNIVVLDGYEFSTDYQRSVKQKGAKLVCIDDLHNKEFITDLIINHTPAITPQDYKAQPYTLYALGLDYVLIRPSFLEQAKTNKKSRDTGTILICFGGADPNGLTYQVLKVVIKNQDFKKIIVITGFAFNRTQEFDKLLLSDNRIRHRHNLIDKEMVESMLEADLCILSASTILYEALTCGCRVISGTSAENQKYVFENFKAAGIIFDAGFFSEEELNKAISTAMKKTSGLNPLIDGQTGERILKLFYQLRDENHLILRKATINDLKLTYRWAADPEIRKYSFDQHQISLSEHTDWFKRKINDPLCLFYIADYHSKPVGSIRFDINGHEAIISYLIDPEYHGKGFGQIILKKGIEMILKETIITNKPIELISGEVIKTNIPSIKSFNRMGFISNDLGNNYRFEKLI